MVKVNLMDVPEEQKSSRDKDKERMEFGPPKNKMDFSFFPEDEQSTSEVKSKKPLFTEETPKPQNPFVTQEEYKEEYEEPPSFEGSIPKSRIIIILGIIGVVILSLLIYLLLGPGGENTEKVKNTATPAEEVSSEQGEGGAMPSSMRSRFTSNQSENQFHINYLDNMLQTGTPAADYSLIVVTTGHVYVSVLGDSRDAIAEYRKSTKDKFPRIQMNIESIEKKFVNGQPRMLADFSIPISTQPPSQPLSSGGGTPGSQGDLASAFRSLAQKHGLQLTYFQQGDQERDANFRKTYYYAKLNGGKLSIIKYLQEIARSYPAIDFFKISLYPANLSAMDQTNINARIELIFYAPL